MELNITINAPDISKLADAVIEAARITASRTEAVLASAEPIMAEPEKKPAKRGRAKAEAPVAVETESPVTVAVEAETVKVERVEAPVPEIAPTEAPAIESVSEPEIKIGAIMQAAARVADAGKRIEVLALMASYGIVQLSALPEDKFSSFCADLRKLGAQI